MKYEITVDSIFWKMLYDGHKHSRVSKGDTIYIKDKIRDIVYYDSFKHMLL